tara:strand:+ start:201 stop:404 length:204 start_codon:yes stop_codon:yes gene_type:complete
MMGNLEKWSILTRKEYKELDFTLKREYIKRYGRKFYKTKAHDGVYDKYWDGDAGYKAQYKTPKDEEG